MCSSTSATRGSTRASGTADGRASRRVAEEPQATRVRGESVIRAVVVELARFARRNTLAAAGGLVGVLIVVVAVAAPLLAPRDPLKRSEEHTSELQSLAYLVCRLLLEKKK